VGSEEELLVFVSIANVSIANNKEQVRKGGVAPPVFKKKHGGANPQPRILVFFLK
jgi:hypothetical protein